MSLCDMFVLLVSTEYFIEPKHHFYTAQKVLNTITFSALHVRRNLWKLFYKFGLFLDTQTVWGHRKWTLQENSHTEDVQKLEDRRHRIFWLVTLKCTLLSLSYCVKWQSVQNMVGSNRIFICFHINVVTFAPPLNSRTEAELNPI